jgi:hypothetical protein
VDIQVIWVFGKTEYFFRRGWTRITEGSLSGKSGDPRGCPVVHAQPHSGSQQFELFARQRKQVIFTPDL